MPSALTGHRKAVTANRRAFRTFFTLELRTVSTTSGGMSNWGRSLSFYHYSSSRDMHNIERGRLLSKMKYDSIVAYMLVNVFRWVTQYNIISNSLLWQQSLSSCYFAMAWRRFVGCWFGFVWIFVYVSCTNINSNNPTLQLTFSFVPFSLAGCSCTRISGYFIALSWVLCAIPE